MSFDSSPVVARESTAKGRCSVHTEDGESTEHDRIRGMDAGARGVARATVPGMTQKLMRQGESVEGGAFALSFVMSREMVSFLTQHLTRELPGYTMRIRRNAV